MPPRLLSLLLALLTLWSAFATQESTFTAASDPDASQVVLAVPSLQSQLQDGSVDDHHLDDLPAQFHLEGGPLDLQGLLLTPHPVPRAVLAMAPPAERETPARAAPFIAGLKRPPRTPPVI